MSSRSPDAGSSGQRRSSSLLIPLIGGVIGFIAALFLLRALDIFESDPPSDTSLSEACGYSMGSYFDQLCNLVSRATEELQSVIAPQTALSCVDSNLDCREHREHLRVGLPTSEQFRDALFELEPPQHAVDWHGRYLTAISQLHSGYHAQFVALQDSDREAFLVAHERTSMAASKAGQLFEDFEIAFTDELAR